MTATGPPASTAPRSRARRRRDAGHRLGTDVDAWVATASPDGAPHPVPLSSDRDGEALPVATPAGGPTRRNPAATRAARLGPGATRDVSVVDGDVEVLERDALPPGRGDRCAARTGVDRTGAGRPGRAPEQVDSDSADDGDAHRTETR